MKNNKKNLDLLKKHLPIAKNIALWHTRKHTQIEFDDAFQEASIALWRVICKGWKSEGYAATAIRRALADFSRNNHMIMNEYFAKKGRECQVIQMAEITDLSLLSKIEGVDISAEELVQGCQISYLLVGLSPRDKQIIIDRYIYGYEQTEILKKHNISKGNYYRLCSEAKVIIKQNEIGLFGEGTI